MKINSARSSLLGVQKGVKAEDIALLAQLFHPVEASRRRQAATIGQFLIGDAALGLNDLENAAVGISQHRLSSGKCDDSSAIISRFSGTSNDYY
jgi:hypothetical protein